MTIDDVVRIIHPDYVSVDNPRIKGIHTPGNTIVVSYKVDLDIDGIHLYVRIK